MNKYSLLPIACILFSLTAFTQDCGNYLFLQKNKTIEMTIYNKKGEPNGLQVYQVSNVASDAGVTTASLNSEMFDKKGKSISKAASTVKCNGGVMMVDMKMMLPQQQAEKVGSVQAKSDNIYLLYPANMSVGDNLKDGNFTMDLNSGGIPETVTMIISNRKVEAKESVTTTAGTWDCFKISYQGKTSVKMGPFPINMNIDGVEWYAPGFGVIKTQNKYGGTAITSIK